MQKIFFLVHTEYHMMVTLSLIADLYDDKEKYTIDIYQVERKNSTRFRFDKNTHLSPNISYNIVHYNGTEVKCESINGSFIQAILKKEYDIFVLFNHHIILPVYLAKQLYKQGTEIHLAPDGAKVYTKSRFTPRWSFLMGLEYWKFVRANKLSFSTYFPTLKYASLKEIKSVYIQFPEAYANITKKEIIRFSVLKSQAAIDLNLNFFKFNKQKELLHTEKTIFYINQPIRQTAILDFEIDVLNDLKNRFKDYNVILKLHPLTNKVQIEKFKKIKGVQLIFSTYPAELYISNLKNSIVLSFWSTACLINNTTTRVYWLHKILERNNMLFDNIKLINPTSHIKDVETIDSIE